VDDHEEAWMEANLCGVVYRMATIVCRMTRGNALDLHVKRSV
jgi:hypothetical protein